LYIAVRQDMNSYSYARLSEDGLCHLPYVDRFTLIWQFISCSCSVTFALSTVRVWYISLASAASSSLLIILTLSTNYPRLLVVLVVTSTCPTGPSTSASSGYRSLNCCSMMDFSIRVSSGSTHTLPYTPASAWGFSPLLQSRHMSLPPLLRKQSLQVLEGSCALQYLLDFFRLPDFERLVHVFLDSQFLFDRRIPVMIDPLLPYFSFSGLFVFAFWCMLIPENGTKAGHCQGNDNSSSDRPGCASSRATTSVVDPEGQAVLCFSPVRSSLAGMGREAPADIASSIPPVT
jgi:hypothetical protein